MRLVTISYIGDEEDIVEAFVRHHYSCADRMVVVCTASGEGTPTVLRRLRNEGLPIEFSIHDPPFHDQAAVLTHVLHDVHCRLRPAWILPLDADEFLQAEGLSASLAGLPRDRVTLLPWRTYVPLPTDDPDEQNPLARIRHRRREEVPQFSKVLIPTAILSSDCAIGPGNHTLLRSGVECPAKPTQRLALAHFPVRSLPQIRRKVTRGWMGIEANPCRGREEGEHWRLLAERFSRGGASQAPDLTDIALRYASPSAAALVHDPVRSPMRGTPARR